ncbi:MAG TPA: hypothetical protein PLU43_08540, partial [Lachnospiraceae bacterium]|nr:hypothetical protein [Lachnospiraceae bacterium]
MEKRVALAVRILSPIVAVTAVIFLVIATMSNRADTTFLNDPYQMLDSGWQCTIGDQPPIAIEPPMNIANIMDDDTYSFRLSRKLPDEIPFGYELGFRLSLQSVRVFVDGEEVYEYGCDTDYPLWRSAGSLYVFVPLLPAYAGKTIEIELSSPYTENKGVINEFYFGKRIAIIQEIKRLFAVRNSIATLFVCVGCLLIAVYF